MLCLFCRSYELICPWKGWLYVSLWKLLFVFLYHWHFETSSDCEESNVYHIEKYPFHPAVMHRLCGSYCSYVFMYMFGKINDESSHNVKFWHDYLKRMIICFFMKAVICFLISLTFRWTLNHIFTNNHVKI
jgi:hypothetical protein